ncbi:MAG: hypothetical protein IJ760_07590 [Bacteroidales bacterium]|nr:hypothetical protein [Bacteroidales bacterium]
MTQDEKWMARYREYTKFIKANHRNPSKHYAEEMHMHSWWKHNRKLLNAGTLKDHRKEKFMKLIALAESNRHVNQYR